MLAQYLVIILSLSVNAHGEQVHPKSLNEGYQGGIELDDKGNLAAVLLHKGTKFNDSGGTDVEAWLFSAAKGKTVFVGLNFYMDKSFEKKLLYKVKAYAYLAAFTKAVQMRFWGLTMPRVEIVFSASLWLIREQESQIEVVESPGKLDGRKTLAKLVAFVAGQPLTVEKSDVVILLTGLNVTDGDDSTVQGVSYYAGACSPKRVAVVEDDGRTFKGANAAAQQVAHLLGATYDGTLPLANLCPASWGYIMSKSPNTWKHHRFSLCSEIMMRFSYGFEMLDRWTCLGTKPGEVYNQPLRLPSDSFTSLTKHSYCSAWNNAESAKKCKQSSTEYPCKFLCCSRKNKAENVVPAPDGFTCNKTMMCLGGKCEDIGEVKAPR
uniref:Putative secreted metalloprotease n=1 Tax=Ixodes ricinus TaxID=34613 RepID=A0A6B0VA26_IXORI